MGRRGGQRGSAIAELPRSFDIQQCHCSGRLYVSTVWGSFVLVTHGMCQNMASWCQTQGGPCGADCLCHADSLSCNSPIASWTLGSAVLLFVCLQAPDVLSWGGPKNRLVAKSLLPYLLDAELRISWLVLATTTPPGCTLQPPASTFGAQLGKAPGTGSRVAPVCPLQWWRGLQPWPWLPRAAQTRSLRPCCAT